MDNEARLVNRAIAGDFDSFAALYSHHMDAVYRYIYFRTGNQQDAEDLTEQSFLKAWEALPNFKQTGCGFINWLYRISHNIVVDHHRRQALITMEDDLPGGDYPPFPEEGTALDRIVRAEEMATLAMAIRQLPEEHQQVIILRFVEGLAHADIGRIIDKSETACRAIQHRALAALNKIFAAQQERG